MVAIQAWRDTGQHSRRSVRQAEGAHTGVRLAGLHSMDKARGQPWKSLGMLKEGGTGAPPAYRRAVCAVIKSPLGADAGRLPPCQHLHAFSSPVWDLPLPEIGVEARLRLAGPGKLSHPPRSALSSS